jgi:outer membrane protein TolC
VKTASFLAATAVTLFATAAFAGYSELDGEFQGYEPPALYRSQTEAGSALPVPADSAQDDEFKAQIDQLRRLKDGWEKALQSRPPEASFFVPPAESLRALEPAASDAAKAGDALKDGFTLETLETLALIRNPGVKAKEREFKAVLEGYGQVENLDTVLRRFSLLTGSLMVGVGNMESPDSITSKFPFPGVLALKGQIVTQDATAASEELEAARREAVTGAREAYWELLYTQSAVETMGRMLTLMDNLRGAVSARYETGEAGFLDLVRVGIEKEKLKEELRTMEEDRKNMEAMIREVLGLPSETPIGSPAVSEPGREELSETDLAGVAKERRQELRAMRAMVGKMERMLEMTETMVYPGFSLGLSSYERKELASAGQSGEMGGTEGNFPVSTTASMGEGLPKMPWFGKDEAYLNEIRQRIEALKKELEMEEAGTALRVRRGWFARDKALREDALYSDRVMTLSQSALEAATSGYSAGKVMFLDLIESFNGWLTASLSAQRARSDLGIAGAKLEAAVGVSPLSGAGK